MTTVRDLAGNDLIINGLVDPGADTNYLKPFLRSIAIEGFFDFPIVLTDYRGRPIGGRHLSEWRQAELSHWNGQVGQERPVLALKDGGLVVGVPVYIGRLIEGMLVVWFSRDELEQIIDPIRTNGRVALLPADQDAAAAGQLRPVEEAGVQALVELPLPESDGLKLSSAFHVSALDRESSYFQWFMFFAFVADLLALIGGVFAAVYLIIRPLRRFIAHLQHSRQDETMDRFDVGDGPSEVRLLAEAFNEFVASEKSLLQERGDQAKRLADALDREKELNGLQRQFVSMVCHEFRTPLAIVDGNAYRLLRRHRTMPPESLEDALTKIRWSVSRLTDLMESVLSAARLEAGTIKFEPQPSDPVTMIEEIVANHQEVNADRTLIANLEKVKTPFLMDVKLMRQVVSNLISNAIKYSDNGTRIWIDASSSDEGDLVISVRDEGVGIPENELSRLFERFFRASTSTGIAGTGIGLHMVQALVDLHRGRVDVTSELGKGTTFTVHLPAPLEDVGGLAADDAQAA
ncbi:MAG: HAMP domain-containing sensor histidine kinase [Alphaproteobacteria bacterium]